LYFKEYKQLYARLEKGETIWNNKVKLTKDIKWGIVPWCHNTFNNSGTGPKGTKVIIGPYIQAIDISNERIVNHNSIIRNGKLESGEDIDYLYIRRHGNDKVKVGTMRDIVWCLPCKDEAELNALLQFYADYPVNFHVLFSDYDCSKKTLVPEWYVKVV
jgi:hypothetical protein